MVLLLIAYGLLLVAVGALASRRVRGPGEFFVAGRSLSAGLLGTTLLAANLGAGSTVGAAELGYTIGLPAWWWVGSAGLGSLLLATTIGPRLWREASARDLYTVGDYLEVRYGKTTSRVAAVILLVGSPAILAGQIIAIGYVLSVGAGVTEGWGAVLGGTLATLYFAMGGLRSASRVNLVQVAVKAAGFLVSVPWLIRSAGGWPALAAAASGTSALSLMGGGVRDTVDLVLLLAPAFVVSPGVLQKVYGARDEEAVRRGVGIQAMILLGYACLPVLLGMTARAHFFALDDPGVALVKLFGEVAPAWLGGLMLAAILSAELSSADAVLFMISTAVARDLTGRVSERRLLPVARAGAVVGGILGVLLALRLRSVIAALRVFYSLLTVTLFVPLVVGLYWKRPGQRVALTAIGAALGAAAVAQWAPGMLWHWLDPVPAGIATSAAVYGVYALAARNSPV